jgi:uncharacterized protein with PQ loop repeat
MLVGFVSQVFFSICIVPQVVKLFTAKTTKGISWMMWTFQGLGYTFGLSYGLLLKEWPLILGNLWGLLGTFLFTIGYLKYRGN